VANVSPVGYAMQGAGLWGQLDLVGNVYEWIMDSLAPYSACTNCANLTSNGGFRGSDFVGYSSNLVPSIRYVLNGPGRNSSIGFRCARSP
jgi:sulfatase modifying factor 1